MEEAPRYRDNTHRQKQMAKGQQTFVNPEQTSKLYEQLNPNADIKEEQQQ